MRPDAQAAQGQVEVVADDQDILRGQPEPADEAGNDGAGAVHEGEGLHEQRAACVACELERLRARLAVQLPCGLKEQLPLRGQTIEHVESDVVPRTGVLGPGVPQSDDQLHGLVLLYLAWNAPRAGRSASRPRGPSILSPAPRAASGRAARGTDRGSARRLATRGRRRLAARGRRGPGAPGPRGP